MTVRSKQLGVNSNLTTTDALLYTTPAGFVTIVKSVVVWNHATSSNTVTLWIKRGGAIIMQWQVILTASGTASGTSYQLPWIVLEPGDQLHGDASAAFCQIIVSGAELLE